MPVHKTTLKGKPAYQWGEHGKKYAGKNAQEKAEKQGRAVYKTGYKKSK